MRRQQQQLFQNHVYLVLAAIIMATTITTSTAFTVSTKTTTISRTTSMSLNSSLGDYSGSSSQQFSSLSSKMNMMRKMSTSMTIREPITMPSQTPMVPYTPPGSDVAQLVDIEAAMYRDRTVMISQYIDENYANNIISIMLYLRKESPTAPISLYLNVPGAQMRPALAVYDLIQNTKQYCEIQTVNLALCGGFGALLCSAGTVGKRGAFPNARFLLQRTGLDEVIRGQAIDIALEVKNMKEINDRMELEWSKITGQTVERIQSDLKRDFYLSADEAVTYGVIDHVMLPSPRKRAARGQDADLGAFEGDDIQRYQNNDEGNQGGWGSRQQTPPNNNNNNKDDDDGPQIAKG